MIEAHLALVEEHIALGDKHIARQREIVAELRRDNHDAIATSARDLLKQFEALQVQHISHKEQLLRILT